MRLKLIALEGPRKGEEVLVREPIVIGRKNTDLNLLDAKVSSRHARIFEGTDGTPQIEDLGSSNGTLVNNKSVTSSPLRAEDVIRIGASVLKVETGPVEAKVETGTWQGDLDKALSLVATGPQGLIGRQKKDGSKPFLKPLLLEVHTGVRAGETMTFGFGPRRVGQWEADFLLFDETAPHLAFELFPSAQHLGEVISPLSDFRINSRLIPRQTREPVKNGDRLSFGQIVLIVREVNS